MRERSRATASYPGQWSLAQRVSDPLCCGCGEGELDPNVVVVLVGSQVLVLRCRDTPAPCRRTERRSLCCPPVFRHVVAR